MPAAGFVVKNVIFKLGTTAYECAVTNVQVTPTTPVQTTSTLCPDGTLSDTGRTTWALQVTANVDLTAGSLYTFLNTHAGQDVAFEFHPDGGTAKWAGTVTVIPVGGTFGVNTWASFTVTLPGDGQFTFTAATP